MNFVPKFNIGQYVYTARDYKIGRYKIDKILFVKEKDEESVQYIVLDPTGKTESFYEKQLLASFDQAKNLALQNWNVIDKQMRLELETFKESNFDKIEKDAKKKSKQNKKKKR